LRSPPPAYFPYTTLFRSILVNNPGTWSHMFAPLQHALWHGCTPTDLVFPFFLFAVGNAMSFVIPRLQEAGDAVFWQKVLKRTVRSEEHTSELQSRENLVC